MTARTARRRGARRFRFRKREVCIAIFGPTVLAVGPDRTRNLLEVIGLERADDRLVAIDAMPIRSAFHDLHPQGNHDDG